MNWDKFDMVGVVTCVGCIGRMDALRRELRRVGIDRPVVSVSDRNELDRFLVQHAPRCGMLANVGYMNSLMNHYRLITTSIGMGYGRILVLEDDVRFVKDLGRLQATVDALPYDADLALFDWWHKAKATDEDYVRLNAEPLVNGCWSRFTDLRSAAAYSLSYNGMLAMSQLVGAALRGDPGGRLRITDQYWPHMAAAGNLNCYCARPPVAVQGWDGETITNMDAMWARYNRVGVRREDYAD